MARLDMAKLLSGKVPEADWLVPGIISRGSMIILAGDAGVGKSFLCFNLSMCLASGMSFLGIPLKPSRVLYFDEENSQPDAGKYLHQNWIGLNRPDIQQLSENFIFESMSLIEAGGRLFRQMALLVAAHDPDLIIIDTASSALNVHDENDNAEALRHIKSLRAVRITKRENCAMLVLKHTLTRMKDVRGAKGWKSALDGYIFHSNRQGRPASLDGLRRTVIEPGKVRAYGLSKPIFIIPERVEQGIILHRDWQAVTGK